MGAARHTGAEALRTKLERSAVVIMKWSRKLKDRSNMGELLVVKKRSACC